MAFDLSRLSVLHVSKAEPSWIWAEAKQARASLGDPDVFWLETCQRVLAIGDLEPGSIPGSSHFKGAQAYRFLLEVSCGLRSAIAGETDIFGQIKQGWISFKSTHSARSSELEPFFQKLFEDTKQIRTMHLKGHGGASYGALVRHLLKGTIPYIKAPKRLICLGAGKIAASVLPYLKDWEIEVWNRSPSRLHSLIGDLSTSGKFISIAALEPGAEPSPPQALLVCMPTPSAYDSEWIKKAEQWGSAVIHLGCLETESGEWKRIKNFLCLSDLFQLKKSQEEVRTHAIDRALRACASLARERAA